MKIYNHSLNIKGGLLLLGIALIASLLIYSQSIVNKLRNDNKEIVQLYAEIIAATVKDESDTNLSFVFDEIIKKVRFPIIYSDRDHNPIYSKNVQKNLNQDQLIQYQHTMSEQNSPIPLEYIDSKTNIHFNIGYLYFGDSILIKRLQWLPFLEIGAVAIFIILGFAGFTLIRNSEKRHIWVGMARETAHQLGTPVSALMGWIDIMKSNPEKIDDMLDEMSTDLKRLEQIVDRFSKMGSEAKMESFDLSTVIEDVLVYLDRRLPSIGKNVQLNNNVEKSLSINGNKILVSWAIENIIKNAIDAIDSNQGKIEIESKRENKYVFINISDNGKGIPRKDWKNIFRPGFSSKAKGWGMGLSLVKRIIEEIHSGKIEVIDSAEGKGTSIQISLPQ
jgi:signal transduction histidine kinase